MTIASPTCHRAELIAVLPYLTDVSPGAEIEIRLDAAPGVIDPDDEDEFGVDDGDDHRGRGAHDACLGRWRVGVDDPRLDGVLEVVSACNSSMPSVVVFSPFFPVPSSLSLCSCSSFVLDVAVSSCGPTSAQRVFVDRLRPSVVLRADNASHRYLVYRLDPPVDLDDARPFFLRLERGLGCGVSSSDTARLPLPGSLSWANGTTSPWTLVDIEGPPTTLDELTHAMDDLGLPSLPANETTFRLRRRPTPSPEPMSDERRGMVARYLGPAFTNLVGDGWSTRCGYDTPDQLDLAVSKRLVDLGLTDGEIAWAFDATPRGIGLTARHRDPGYLARTIDLVRGRIPRPIVGPSTLRIRRVIDHSERMAIDVEVIAGPRKGKTAVLNLTLGRSSVAHALASAGVDGPPDRATIRRMAGTTADVTLRVHDNGNVEVALWLPRTPEPTPAPRQAAIPEQALIDLGDRGIGLDVPAFQAACDAFRSEQLALAIQGATHEVRQAALRQLVALSSVEDPLVHAARANPFGIVHATWLAFRTWTGRSTAVRPAIQQVPRHLRQAFRAPPGHVFILADWSHAQARILAGASRDPDLLTVLSDPGRDLYIEIGQDAAPDTPDVRALGKRLLIPLLFHAGPKRLQQRAAEVGVTLSLEEAKYVKARFMARFKVFAAWREGLKTMTSFRSPAGRMVTVPPPDPRRRRGSALSRITAGIAQSAEADALGLVVGGWRREVPPDQGGIVLLMHDGIVFEVREENATATTARVDRLMESSLRAVCGPCRPAWSIETRRTWGKP